VGSGHGKGTRPLDHVENSAVADAIKHRALHQWIFARLYNRLNLSSTFKMAENTSRFGFVAFAETWNGRLAMLGFIIGLGTELLTGQGILGQLGLG
jgi:hypothetical protein